MKEVGLRVLSRLLDIKVKIERERAPVAAPGKRELLGVVLLMAVLGMEAEVYIRGGTHGS